MSHRFKFVRAGGFDQVEITTGADLLAIPELDQKLWVALSVPTTGIQFDERTLSLLDTDNDKRIRAPELIETIKWVGEVLKDPETLVEGKDTLSLAAINGDHEQGKLLLKTAKAVLKTLGKADAKGLSVTEATGASAAFDKDPFNGDGVLVEASVEDADLKQTFKDILATTTTPEKDKSGDDGVGEVTLAAFFKEIAAHAEWLKKGADADVLVLGDKTVGAYAALSAVQGKIADYFARAKIAAYDPRALAAINGEEKQYLELAAKDLDVTASEVEKLPLAQIVADKPLSLTRGINPAWADKVAAFKAHAVEPVVGNKDVLSEADWTLILGKFTPHSKWAAEKAGASVEKLGAERVKALAAGDHEKKLLALIAEDKEREPEAKAIESLEKLVRVNRDLMTLVNNFVAFRDFYSRKAPAMFQVGTLYLDTRACELCVKVDNAAKHATMAPLSNAYLLYCDLKNAKGETMQIAAAMTAGDVDNLMVGRNGIFYDRKGGDWDATVTKVVDNPISVRQAFWSPYKKVLRMIEERVAKRAADEAAERDAGLTAGVDSAASSVEGAPPVDAPPAGIDIGTLAAIGVAVGGITAALGALLSAFFGLGLWMPLGVLGLILCISGPSMAIAWLKLRKRNLGPILDANGWAVNAQAIVNVPLGGSLTKEAVLPPGSSIDMHDPFAEKRRPWGFYFVLLALLVATGAWFLGALDTPPVPQAVWSSNVLPASLVESLQGAPEEDAAEETPEAEAAPEAPAAD